MKTETFSYLAPLSNEQIAQQIQYFLNQGWIPGIEYTVQIDPTTAYWNWWKLPLFSAKTPSEALTEIESCKAAHPGCFIRVTAYDNNRQGQVMGFVVHRPRGGE
ncbi:MAG: ribulose bisphosphate carboxylase small subunit [Chloroflexi bacterium]|nr:ribulose bisphosphate carboxylase small subunit [Chloroflexota bacterium]